MQCQPVPTRWNAAIYTPENRFPLHLKLWGNGKKVYNPQYREDLAVKVCSECQSPFVWLKLKIKYEIEHQSATLSRVLAPAVPVF